LFKAQGAKMKSLIGALLLTIPVMTHAAYYLEDEVPQKITAQMAVVETTYQPQPAYTYNVPFYSQKYLLGSSAVAALKNVLGDLQKSKAITIQGRPDANGHNDTDLARRRAMAIKKYLVTSGINENRITVTVEKEIRFDSNPDVFNSTIYTGEALPELPKKVKSSFYSETPASQQANQQSPVPNPAPTKATTPTQVAVQTTSQSTQAISQAYTSEKVSKVEGTFKVLNQAQVIDKPAQPSIAQQPATYDFPVNADLSSESRTAIARFATSNKISVIVADGSIAGFKKARELSSFIAEVTGSRPDIKAKGAPKGLVIVKG
jgi:hypothetical protein